MCLLSFFSYPFNLNLKLTWDYITEVANDEEEAEGIVLQQPRYPWERSDRDYIYDELLGRVFNILRENNTELAGDRRHTVMRPPQVLREGTKKSLSTLWTFARLVRLMGQQRLVVKGRFAPKNFEGILRRYLSTSFALVARGRRQYLKGESSLLSQMRKGTI
ncbi:hypothetical protein F2Q70_00014581 [Brassica cretica]|uniref:Uncharacterized protein n=1 Tax=Brassica cretica TaxID=69181 RepID=A0A8S9HY00_BRACR|nr:hypothetical protein F2Q70_00014581 [Brassica cretica]